MKKIVSIPSINNKNSIAETFNSSICEAIVEFNKKWNAKQFKSLDTNEQQHYFLQGKDPNRGHINDPHFVSYQKGDYQPLFQFYYKLAVGSKAATAMSSLMTTNSIAVLCCQSRQKVIMYRALQLFLQKSHGNEEGDRIFNELFSNLALSEVSLAASQAMIVESNIYPVLRMPWQELSNATSSLDEFSVLPLHFFYDDSSKRSKINTATSDGDLSIFWNDTKYKRKHPFGISRFEAVIGINGKYNSMIKDKEGALLSVTEINQHLISEFNKLSAFSSEKIEGLPNIFDRFQFKQDLLDRLITKPESVILELKKWEKEQNEILLSFKAIKASEKTVLPRQIKQFVANITKVKQGNFSQDHFNTTEALGCNVLYKSMTVYRQALIESDKKRNDKLCDVVKQLINMATFYRVSSEFNKANYYYNLASKMMSLENYMGKDPIHQDELIQQKNRLVHQTKLNQFETLMSQHNFRDFICFLMLTKQAGAGKQLNDIFSGNTFLRSFITSPNIMIRINDITSQFHIETAKPCDLFPEIPRELNPRMKLITDALVPIIEEFVGFAKSIQDQMLKESHPFMLNIIRQSVKVLSDLE